MSIYYVNHLGQKIDFMSGCYNVESSTFFEHKWEHESIENGYGGKIESFKKGIQEKKLQLHIESVGLIACEEAYDTLHDCIEIDVLKKQPGKLYVGNYYLKCYLAENKPVYMVPGIGSTSYEFGIISEYPFWIKEETYYIPPIDIEGEWELLEVPASLPNTNFTDCNYRLRVYGPFPSQWAGLNKLFFYIGDNQVQVDYTCKENEYIELDTRNETISLVNVSSGSRTNIYHLQNFNLDIFKKIPPGENVLKYDRSYAMEITLFHERSEPKWNKETPETYFFITSEDGYPLMTEDGYYIVGAHQKGGTV